MSSYKKARQELAEQREQGSYCRMCNGGAPWQVLSDHGGMCYPCYQQSGRSAHRAAHDVGDKRNGLRDWARALKARHDSGERLTPYQVEAYRVALKRDEPPEDWV